MLETTAYRKNKINLEDYDYKKDIKNRLLLSELSSDDLIVLEEILFSPLKCPIERLAKNLEMSTNQLQPHIDKLAETGLFSQDADLLLIDKDMRKYFEMQIRKFEDDFKPGMDFLQSLLKKVPIHVLPNWYPIPRTSNNIFEALIEKYFQTPQTFQRYLSELSFGDETLSSIISDIFQAEDYRIHSQEIINRYGLSQEQFEEMMLILEFNFVCCLVYEKSGNEWVEVITLFHEWRQYLNFLKESEPKEIENPAEVNGFSERDFSFIEDLSSFLQHALTKDLPLSLKDERWVLSPSHLHLFDNFPAENSDDLENYLAKLIQKAVFLKLAVIESSHFKTTDTASQWLALGLDKRAMSVYKHTQRSYPFSEFSSELCSDRNIREIEKSIQRVLDKEWVLYESFERSVTCALSEESRIVLKKKGRNWEYTLPKYSDEEKKLIHKIIYEWMFEAGFIKKGTYQGRPCLKVTEFGRTLFS